MNIIKKITPKTAAGKFLSLLIMLTFFSLFVLIYLVVSVQNKIAMVTAVKNAKFNATSMLSGLNEMMLSGTIKDASRRKQIFSLFKNTSGIHEFKFVRGSAVDEQYGPGMDMEKPDNGWDRKILNSHKIITNVFTENGVKYIKVGVPLVAKTKERGIDCLACHDVKNDTVIGGISVIYSLNTVDHYTSVFMESAAILIIVVVLILLIGIYFIFRLSLFNFKDRE